MELELNVVAGGELDKVEPMFSRSASDAAMAIGQLDAISAVMKDFDHGSPCLKLVRVGHAEKLERRTAN